MTSVKYILMVCCITLCAKAFGQETNVINPISDVGTFLEKMRDIKSDSNALYVFDIDNTILITNDNKFGSDWWYAQSKENARLLVGVDDICLFNVLTPLFYSSFDTRPVFSGQPQSVNTLGQGKSQTIALTARGYSPVVAKATELELTNNGFEFLKGDSMNMDTVGKVVMVNNVMYTKGGDKGAILLNYVKTFPYSNIYYFDDTKAEVLSVQEAFNGQPFEISINHMLIAEKIPYTLEQQAYMEQKLRNLILKLNELGNKDCTCTID